MKVRFEVYGEPCGKGRPRFSRLTGHAYTPKKTENYEAMLRMEYEYQTGRFFFPEDSELDLRIVAYYGVPRSKSKKIQAKMLSGEIRPTKKPDMDNVIKIVADALNGVAYRDDVQIVDCQCRKFYSADPRIVVTIQEVTKDGDAC